MIIIEIIEDGTRIRQYSDQGFKIKQLETGYIYCEAIDIIPCEYTYEETDVFTPEKLEELESEDE